MIKLDRSKTHFNTDWVERKEYEKRLQSHERFTATPKRVRRIRFFKSDEAFLNSWGEWRTSAMAWSEGVLIFEESKHVTVLLDRMHLQTYYYHDNHHKNLDRFLNQPMEVEVGTIVYKNNHAYVVLTRRPILTDVYNKLVKDNKPFTAKIVKFANWGAFLKYDGLRIRIKNNDFTDNPRIGLSDVYHLGDEIEVVPVHHNDANVDLAVKFKDYPYKFNATMSWQGIQKQGVYQGKIKYWSPTGVYTQIAPGVDGLSPYPNLELDQGCTVFYKVFNVDSANKKLRGAVIKVLPENKTHEEQTQKEMLTKTEKESIAKDIKAELDSGKEPETDLLQLSKLDLDQENLDEVE